MKGMHKMVLTIEYKNGISDVISDISSFTEHKDCFKKEGCFDGVSKINETFLKSDIKRLRINIGLTSLDWQDDKWTVYDHKREVEKLINERL